MSVQCSCHSSGSDRCLNLEDKEELSGGINARNERCELLHKVNCVVVRGLAALSDVDKPFAALVLSRDVRPKIPPEIMEEFHFEALRTYMGKESGKFEDIAEISFAALKLGSIAKELGILRGLVVCDLSGNGLSDLPANLFTLKHLERLNISGNQFEKFPEVLFKLESLNVLEASNNKIDHIPADLNKLGALGTVRLVKNPIQSADLTLRTTSMEIFLEEDAPPATEEQLTVLKLRKPKPPVPTVIVPPPKSLFGRVCEEWDDHPVRCALIATTAGLSLAQCYLYYRQCCRMAQQDENFKTKLADQAKKFKDDLTTELATQATNLTETLTGKDSVLGKQLEKANQQIQGLNRFKNWVLLVAGGGAVVTVGPVVTATVSKVVATTKSLIAVGSAVKYYMSYPCFAFLVSWAQTRNS